MPTSVPANCVEGPQKRKPCDMSSWHRVVESDGSTVCYTPDEATAKEHAAASELADALETICKRLANTAGGGMTFKSRESLRRLARAALKKAGRIS